MSDESEITTHPFGGCNKLLSQYACIGNELLKYEISIRRYGYGSFSSFSNFQTGVSFVPLEVLESYLEDLLDLDVSDDKLFIERESRGVHWLFVSAAGLSAAIALGLYAASSGASLIASFGLTVCLAFPFGVMWHYAPRDGVARRMGFAQVVSHEVGRRRGGDKGPGEIIRTRFLFADLLAQKTPGSARSAAMTIFH